MLYRVRIVDRGKKRWLILEADKLERVGIQIEGGHQGDITDVVVETPFPLLLSFDGALAAGAVEVWWET